MPTLKNATFIETNWNPFQINNKLNHPKTQLIRYQWNTVAEDANSLFIKPLYIFKPHAYLGSMSQPQKLKFKSWKIKISKNMSSKDISISLSNYNL